MELGGRFIASAPRSDYFRFDHSFIPGERVRGSFVRFDKMGTGIKVYALFDLEDGRKTRVDVKYLKSLNGREAMLMPGDKVTMTANSYSTRLNQPSWKIESTPRRFDRYRSAELNRKVGGVATSNHLTGCAVDIRVAGKEQLLRYACILLLCRRDETGL